MRLASVKQPNFSIFPVNGRRLFECRDVRRETNWRNSKKCQFNLIPSSRSPPTLYERVKFQVAVKLSTFDLRPGTRWHCAAREYMFFQLTRECTNDIITIPVLEFPLMARRSSTSFFYVHFSLFPERLMSRIGE